MKINVLGPLYTPIKDVILSYGYPYPVEIDGEYIDLHPIYKSNSIIKSEDQWKEYFELTDKYRDVVSNLSFKLNTPYDIKVIYDYLKDENNQFDRLVGGSLYCNGLEFINRKSDFIVKWLGEVYDGMISKPNLHWEEIKMWIYGM